MASIRLSDLERAVADLIADAAVQSAGRSWEFQAYDPDVNVTSVRVIDEGPCVIVELRFENVKLPGQQLGARLHVKEHLINNLDFGAGDPETVVAEFVLVALGELTFAGGDPQSWEADDEGTRWYVGEVF